MVVETGEGDDSDDDDSSDSKESEESESGSNSDDDDDDDGDDPAVARQPTISRFNLRAKPSVIPTAEVTANASARATGSSVRGGKQPVKSAKVKVEKGKGKPAASQTKTAKGKGKTIAPDQTPEWAKPVCFCRYFSSMPLLILAVCVL